MALEFLLLLEKMDNAKLLKVVETFQKQGEKEPYYLKLVGAIEKYRKGRYP